MEGVSRNCSKSRRIPSDWGAGWESILAWEEQAQMLGW